MLNNKKKIIETSKLFDQEWYMNQYGEVKESGIDPAVHYLTIGWKKGYWPGPQFDGDNYLEVNQDVKKANMNPLLHYELRARKENRKGGIFKIKNPTLLDKFVCIFKNTSPKFSIIVNCYNGAQFLRQNLESLINQTYKNFEIIIIDDGSIDDTVSIIKEYIQRYTFIKLYMHDNHLNKGLLESMRLAISKATGDYVCFCDQDDYWREDNLKEKVNIINSFSRVLFIANDLKKVYQDDTKNVNFLRINTTYSRLSIKKILKINPIPTLSCITIKHSLLKRLNLKWEKTMQCCLDWFIILQIICKYTKIFVIPKKITFWRIHKNSLTAKTVKNRPSFIYLESLLKREYFLLYFLNFFPVWVRMFYKKLYSFIRSPFFIKLGFSDSDNAKLFVNKSDDSHEFKDVDVKLLAFYLPQFHLFEENEIFHGKGFTEWTNVTKSKSLFIGHYQPQLPIDVGFYDLSTDNVMFRQIELAKSYGIYGFVFHYYWFSGKRLMEKPIFNWLQNQSLNFPFCLCWANENWTKKWDGGNGEILVKQTFCETEFSKFFDDILPFFKDSRYIKVHNKPLFIIYRANLWPKELVKNFIKFLRERILLHGFEGIYIVSSYFEGGYHPDELGLDTMLEFPPHMIDQKLASLPKRNIMNNKPMKYFSLKNYIYSGSEPLISKDCFRGVFPSWDNTPRRGDQGRIYHISSFLYFLWLQDCIYWTKVNKNTDEQFVFINAWNEWAEGAHLEPDNRYGYAYCQATRDALEFSKINYSAEELSLIKQSKFLKKSWYKKYYGLENEDDPAKHYLLYGWKKGYWPSLNFTPFSHKEFYEASEKCNANPLLIFEKGIFYKNEEK